MKITALALILASLAHDVYAGQCKINFNLNSYKYNCAFKNLETPDIIQYSSDCPCEDSAKQRAESSEGPIYQVSHIRCEPLHVIHHKKLQKTDKDFHQFQANSYLKNTPMRNGFQVELGYLRVKKKHCK